MRELLRFSMRALPFSVGLILLLTAISILVGITGMADLSDLIEDGFIQFVVLALVGIPTVLYGITKLSSDTSQAAPQNKIGKMNPNGTSEFRSRLQSRIKERVDLLSRSHGSDSARNIVKIELAELEAVLALYDDLFPNARAGDGSASSRQSVERRV